MTLVFGVIIIVSSIEWEQLKLIIGLYLLIVGTINLTGHVLSILTRNKIQKTYIETEVFQHNFKENEAPKAPGKDETEK